VEAICQHICDKCQISTPCPASPAPSPVVHIDSCIKNKRSMLRLSQTEDGLLVINSHANKSIYDVKSVIVHNRPEYEDMETEMKDIPEVLKKNG